MNNSILDFVSFSVKGILNGSKKYYTSIAVLCFFMFLGLYYYARQLAQGLNVTGLTDQVSWGMYISNFTYMVGVAAGAVMLVIPAYIYKKESMHEIVIFGELLAISSIVMCLLFVTADMGRPDRMWHMIPLIGIFNFPMSILSWDVIVLQGYFILNIYVATYLLYKRFKGEHPNKKYYVWAVYISIIWAFSLHTVTAFLYNGLGSRPFWNSAIIAPRFLASACVVGPALTFLIIRYLKRSAYIELAFFERAQPVLRNIITVALAISMFFLISEIFTEFYTDTMHVASVHYLFFGLHGHYGLVPYMWASVILNVSALMILLIPRFSQKEGAFVVACVLAIVGIWIEKGMGFIVPGFIPTPLGEVVEYSSSYHEIFISIGILAAGALVYTVLMKAALPILLKPEK